MSKGGQNKCWLVVLRVIKIIHINFLFYTIRFFIFIIIVHVGIFHELSFNMDFEFKSLGRELILVVL